MLRPRLEHLVIDWLRAVWADRGGSDIEFARDQLHNSLSKTDLPIHIFAILDGIPAGTAALKQHELTDVFLDYHYWLGSVFVKEDVRDGEIASEMSLHIMEMAKQLFLPHLYLKTINLGGGLYSKLGWESVTQFTHMDEQALLMLQIL